MSESLSNYIFDLYRDIDAIKRRLQFAEEVLERNLSTDYDRWNAENRELLANAIQDIGNSAEVVKLISNKIR